MRKVQQITNAVSRKLNIPTEILSREPSVTVKGWAQAVVEPHGGILEFSPEQICLRTGQGKLCIQGTGLTITRMNHRAVEIAGKLRGILLEETT